MSKNLTRKGLAFGALVALGSSVVAGAPANAAPTALSIASAYGTSTSTLLGSSFNVAISGTGISATANDFKVYVEGAVSTDFASTSDVQGRAVTDLTETTTSYSDIGGVEAGSATDKTSVISGITPAVASYQQIRVALSTAEVTATRTIKLTPFVDNGIANGKPDANEVKGNTLEVTFVKASEVTATTTLSAPKLGSSKLKSVVTLDKGINLEQLVAANSTVYVAFKDNGSFADTDETNSTVKAVWSKADAALVAEEDSVDTAIAANRVYSAQAKIDNGTSKLASGTIATATVTAGTIDVVDADVTTDDKVGGTAGANVRKITTNSWGVRTGTATVAVSSGAITKLDDNSVAVSVGAGVPAKVTVTAAALATGSSFTAGGKSATATSGTSSTFTFDTTTNADGKVAFDLAATGKAGDRATVSIEVLDKTTYIKATNAVAFGWEDAVVNETAVDSDAVGLNAVRSVKTGGSYTLNYSLTDNFGALYAGTDRRVKLTVQSVSGVVAAINTNVVFSGGKASFTGTDSNSDAGSFVVRALVQKYTASTDAWTDVNSSSYLDTTVYVQKNVTPGFVTGDKTLSATGGLKPAISYNTLANYDFRLDTNSKTYAGYALSATTEVTVSGTVLNTDGVAIAGTPVVISGTGILFNANDTVLSLGSITVLTTSAGAYSVKAYSNKAGVQDIKVTAGSISKTISPEWLAAAAAKATVISITAPATTAPGTTTGVVVKLTDKFGNAVETSSAVSFSIRVTGSGSTGTIAANTDSNGEVKFNQVLASNETGSFKITVKYDSDAAATGSAEITKEAVVTIAAAAAPVAVEPTSKIGTANSRVYVNVKDGKGAVVTVKIGAKWYTKSALNNDYTFSFKAKKKSKVSVKVYVDGDLSSSKTITVK